jgi:phenylacetate-CoA ligase
MTTVAADLSTPLALGAQARELLERDRWPREQLLEFQRKRLRGLLRHAVDRSPYYREALGPDAEDADLAQLPTLPKRLLMEQFDRIVTDPRVRLGGLESFLDSAAAGAAYLGEFRVFSTSGTSGTPGIFAYSQQEFSHWAAVFLRSLARLGVTAATRLAGIGAPSSLHLSRQIIAVLPGAGTGAPLLSVTTPLDEMVAALNAYQPEALGGYASVIGVLAEEQLQGRLEIAPRIVFTSSEVLTDDAAARIASAWTKPAQGYFTTEVGVVASGSLDHVGLHVCEEAILEVVDERGRPVPPGVAGSRVLLTNLVNRVQPLIRYELTDAVLLEAGPDPSGRPYDRIARIDGRGDDVLHLPSAKGGTVAVNPFRLRAPFVRLLDVLQYQVVHRADGILVRIVRRESAPRDLPDRVRAAVEGALADAGAEVAVRVDVVDEIEREPGHGAKLKLVVSEVPSRA